MSPEVANHKIGNFIGIGVLLGVIAGCMLGLASGGGDTAEVTAAIGLVVAAIGGVVLFVGIMSVAVKYGVAASRLAPPVVATEAAEPKADA